MAVRDEILRSVASICAAEHEDLQFYNYDGYSHFGWQSRPDAYAHPINFKTVAFERNGLPLNCENKEEITAEFFAGACAVEASIEINGTGLYVSTDIPESEYRMPHDFAIAVWLIKAIDDHDHDSCEAGMEQERQQLAESLKVAQMPEKIQERDRQRNALINFFHRILN